MSFLTRARAWLGRGEPLASDPMLALVNGQPLNLTRHQIAELDRAVLNGSMRKAQDGMSAYQGVPAYWFSRAIEVGGQETLFEPFRNSVWVQRAVKLISGPVSSVPIQFLAATHAEPGTGKLGRSGPIRRIHTARRVRQAGESDLLSLPEVEAWLEQPSPGLTYDDFIEATIGWLKLKGEAFWLLSDELLVPFPEVRRGQFPPLIVARPDRMRQVIDQGQLVGWVYTDPFGGAKTLLPEQVIQPKFWNPYDVWRGLSEFDSAQVAAEADWLAGKYSRNLMANNGDTGPFIVAKNGVPSDPQREQIIQDLKAKRQAQLRGDFRPIFLTGDISVEDPKLQSVDANYIAQRLEHRHEIAAAFGVPMSMFDVRNDYSMGSQSAWYQLVLNTCIPTGAKVCEALELLIARVLRQPVEVGLFWDDHPVMQTVRRERLAAVEGLANRGMPMHEISEYLGLDLPRFPGDDVGLLPIGLAPAEQVTSAPDPTEDPALAEPEESDAEDQPDPADQSSASGPAAAEKLLTLLRSREPVQRVANRARWNHHMRQRATAQRSLEVQVRKALFKARAQVLQRLPHLGPTDKSGAPGTVAKSLVDLLFDAGQFAHDLAGTVLPTLQTAVTQASAQALAEIGWRDPWKLPPQKVRDFIDARRQPVQDCSAAVRSQLNTALQAGLDAGETSSELADRVRTVFTDLGKAEAERIAKTEAGMAYNFSRNETFKGVGITHKRWLSSHGPTVRPAHRQAEIDTETRPIPMHEPFMVEGEPLMYPGDPSGTAGNIINCQCVMLAVDPNET